MPINYRNYLSPNITTATVVYNPVSTGIQATVIGLLLSNTSSTNAVATVTLTSGTVTASIVTNVIIPVGSSLNVVDASRLIVAQNNFVTVTPTASVDVIVSTVEVT